MIALLIGSIFEGNRIEQEQAAAKQQPVNPEKRPVRQYTPNGQAAEEKQAEEVEVPTEEMQTEIQKVIPEFLKVYVAFNAKDDFLKNSKPYLTENLYKAIRARTAPRNANDRQNQNDQCRAGAAEGRTQGTMVECRYRGREYRSGRPN
ncbi:hypothetical protein ACMX2M_07850 [Paenibacillus polymyxa]